MALMSESNITIEIVYGTPHKQYAMQLAVAEQCTVEQAIISSNILKQCPEIDLKQNAVGIWNKTCKLDTTLENGDRIEIYRPLIADPKEVRKRRAEQAKQEGRADKVTGGRVNPLRGQKAE